MRIVTPRIVRRATSGGGLVTATGRKQED